MREHLLGYLLGVLEAAEHEDVERQLEHDSGLHKDLNRLRNRLDLLRAASADHDPPPGLADRTLLAIARHDEVALVMPAHAGLSAAMGPDAMRSDAVPTNSWSLADSVVAIGVMLVAAMLFLPAIVTSRSMARIEDCRNHLRQLGTALFTYSDLDGDHELPSIPDQGSLAFAGAYGLLLWEKGLLPDERILVCPDSEPAQQSARFAIPTRHEIDRASESEREVLRRVAGGSYGYTFGYWNGHRYTPHRHEGRSYFPLMSDAPSHMLQVELTSNHGRRGQNLLYDDGRVAFIAGSPGDSLLDHPFRNRHGQIAVGVDRDDAVIASSGTVPIIQFLKTE